MARLTNEETRNMSINEADRYTDEHPTEAWRFAKAHGAAAIKQTKKAAKNGFKTGTLFAEPDMINLSDEDKAVPDCHQRSRAVSFLT